MKRILLYSTIVLLLLPCLTFAQGVKELTLTGNPAAGEYKARDKVSVVPVAGTGTRIVAGSRLFCDPNIQVAVDYSSNGGAGFTTTTKNIDQSKPVGSITGYHDVSAYGGAIYTIPLDLPKGTGGVNYPVQLIYNNGGQGLAGMGWNISGLHLIARTGYNYSDDAQAAPIGLSNTDNFSFDGNRLIPDVAANNGKDNTIYHTHIDGFTLTTSHTTDADKGPDWFEVKTKEGEIMEFGNTSDSKATTQKLFNTSSGFVQKTVVTFWYINKITDKNGNYILFDYENKGGSEIILKSIRYAGNTTLGINPDKSINFYYDISGFSNSVYVGGGLVNRSVLLRKVEIKKNSETLRSYKMTYNKRNTFEFLVSIEEKNAAGETYNSTDFTYEVPTATSTLTSLPVTGTGDMENKRALYIDYNGDGFKDIVTVPNSDASGDGNWYLYKNIKTGFQYQASGNVNLPSSYLLNYFYLKEQTNANTMVSDFNGDGKEDFMIYALYTDGATDKKKLKIKRYISTGSGFSENPSGGIDIILGDAKIYFANGDPPVENTQVKGKAFSCDINGDGKTDLVVVRSDGNEVITDVYTDLSASVSYTKTMTGNFSIENVTVADIDADGKMEILNLLKATLSSSFDLTMEYYDITFQNNSLTDIYKGTSAPFLLPKIGCYRGTQAPSGTTEFTYMGDFNGDGSTDGLKYQSSASSWSVDYCFGGTNKFNKVVNGWMGDPTNCNHDYTFGDVNMDGKTDVIFIEHDFNGTGKSYAHIFYSTGSGFFNGMNFSFDVDFRNFDFNFVNINGDAGGELVINGPYIISNQYFFSYNFTEQLGKFGSLKKITTGLNQESIFNYATSSDANSGYTATESLSYPYNTLTTPFRFVKSIQTTNGLGGYTTTEYTYENATVSRTGKGFLGFKKASVYTIDLKTKTEKEFELNSFPMLLPTSTKVYNYATGSAQLLSTQIFHYGLDAVWSGARSTYMVKPLTSPNSNTLTDNLANVTVTTTVTVDDYGNVTDKMTDNGVEKVICNYTYDNSKLFTVPHLLNEELTTIERGGQQNKRKSISTYTANHLLETRIERPEPDPNAKAVTTAFEYYATGNLKKKTNSAAAAETITESYEYDANFVNVDKTTNPLSQSAFITYDAIFDVPVKTTDINGLVTKYKYDNWQRAVSVTYPNNTTATKKYEWVSAGDVPNGQNVNVSNVIYKITETTPNQPTVVTYYDILNRAVLTQTQGFTHTLFAGVEYNSKGQKIIATNAYSTTASVQAPVITTYAYNGLNQLESETVVGRGTPLTTTYSYTYGGGNYTWTANPPDGKNQVKITDASGKVIVTLDNGGSVTHNYELHSSSNTSTHTTTVTGMTTPVTIAEFDEAGHQSSLTDLAAGTTTYRYNPYGQVIHQEDASQNKYDISYDKLGRVDTKTGDEGVYTYHYETSNNGLNKLSKVESPGNVSYSYIYDNFQRLTKITEEQSGQSFVTKYKYDVFGNQTEITYPNNFAILQDFNDNGYMTAIRNKDDGTTIWQGVATNEMGQFTTYVMGNHKVSNRSYTNFGQPVAYSTAGVQQLDFNFNASTGNLDSRTTTNPNYNYTETFDYSDPLKRLKGWTHTLSSDNFSMTYNDFGQFQTKSGAGTYSYQDEHLTGVTGDAASAIPLITQKVHYNEFRKPKSIDLLDDNTTQDVLATLTYTYGADQQRIKGEWKDASAQTYRKRYYATNYEVTEEGLQADRHTYQVAYINSPTGLCAMYVKKDNAQGELHYTYTDYLGSILVVTDKDGVTEADQNFDAWGRYRDPQTLDYTVTPNVPAWLYRGFTGHEMLPEFGLINMNARLYDPVLGLMLAPDNVIQAPGYTQSYNRYSYVWNNPLKFIDPTGNEGDFPTAVPLGQTSYSYYMGTPTFTSSSYNFANSYNSGYGGNNLSYGYSTSSSYSGTYDNGGLMANYSYTSSSSFSSSTTYSASSVNYSNSYSNSSNYSVDIGGELFSFEHQNSGSYSITYPNYDYQIKQTLSESQSGTGWDFYVGNVIGAAEINLGNIIMDRAKYSFTLAPWETRVPVVSDIVVRTPLFNFNIANEVANIVGTSLQWTGRGLGGYNAFKINDLYFSDKIALDQMLMEQATNIYSTLGGINGAAWGIGWELGRTLVNSNWYQQSVHNVYITEPYECVMCPK